jgi:hypothetical protein
VGNNSRQISHHKLRSSFTAIPEGRKTTFKMMRWNTQASSHDDDDSWKPPEYPPEPHSTPQFNDGDSDNDLKPLLTEDQRKALVLLISAISETIKKNIADTFDASYSSDLISFGNDDSKHPTLKPGQRNLNIEANVDRSEDMKEEEEKAQRLRKKREEEVGEESMQELKRGALAYAEKWSLGVENRVREVVGESGDEKLQKEGREKGKQDEGSRRPEYKVVGMGGIFKSMLNPRDRLLRCCSDGRCIDSQDSIHDEETTPDAALINLYPPTSTSLLALPRDKRIILLHSTLLLLLSLEHYNAHSRILLLHLTSSLHLPLQILSNDEIAVAKTLLEASKALSASEEAKKRGEENQTARRWKVGLAGVAGAALIGITGGLAAPLVAAGIGSILGGLGLGATAAAGLLGALAQSGVVVGALFGAYGGKMTSEMMDMYAKEVEDFAFLPLRKSRNSKRARTQRRRGEPEDVPLEDRRLRVTVGISGWLTQKEDVITPWRTLEPSSEIFALRWELAALLKLGVSMESVVKSTAWTLAKKEIIQRTVFGSLMLALWPLNFLKFSKVLDNPFSVAKNRADKAGLVLADALINRAQGERPVCLVGYSLGARVIYSCLMSLAERKAFGLVESAVLIGAPIPSDRAFWRTMKGVVTGRLVNVYSENDYVLAFLYRTSSIQLGVAGLQAIEDVKGVENVDVSELVEGHLRYQYLVGVILQQVGWEGIDSGQVERERETIRLLDEEGKEVLGEEDDVDADGGMDEKDNAKDKDAGEAKCKDPLGIEGMDDAKEVQVKKKKPTNWAKKESDFLNAATEKLHLG